MHTCIYVYAYVCLCHQLYNRLLDCETATVHVETVDTVNSLSREAPSIASADPSHSMGSTKSLSSSGTSATCTSATNAIVTSATDISRSGTRDAGIRRDGDDGDGDGSGPTPTISWANPHRVGDDDDDDNIYLDVTYDGWEESVGPHRERDTLMELPSEKSIPAWLSNAIEVVARVPLAVRTRQLLLKRYFEEFSTPPPTPPFFFSPFSLPFAIHLGV